MFHLNITIMILAKIFLLTVITIVASAIIVSLIDAIIQLRQ